VAHREQDGGVEFERTGVAEGSLAGMVFRRVERGRTRYEISHGGYPAMISAALGMPITGDTLTPQHRKHFTNNDCTVSL
jgi:hypothetical protein